MVPFPENRGRSNYLGKARSNQMRFVFYPAVFNGIYVSVASMRQDHHCFDECWSQLREYLKVEFY
jgi:hypothetical protein